MKKIVCFIVLALLIAGASLTSVSQTNGSALVTMQNAWVIAETENSGDTEANVWAVTERTRKISEALIVANAANETNISTFRIPSKWNSMRFRAAGITDDGTVTHQIYLGILGGGQDCELTYVGQLAWIIGKQQTIYDQIAFTSGGTYVPKAGDTVTGNGSKKTAVIVSISALTGGAWVDGDAAGTITYRSATGVFTNTETITIKKANRILSSNAYTHAGSDLIDFELADTLTVTAKAWGASWSSVSPADDTSAEAELDLKGSDYMQIITTATNADTKLLVTGY